MLNKKLINRKEKGFTIIEVLIVLAIAALILLIVFLAVPALQRNARNTSRRSDVARLLAGFNEFVANNNGTPPSTDTQTGTAFQWTSGTASNVTLGYYTSAPAAANNCPATPTNQAVYLVTAYGAACSGSNNTDSVFIIESATCATSSTSQAGTSTKQVVALYGIENGSANPVSQCVSS